MAYVNGANEENDLLKLGNEILGDKGENKPATPWKLNVRGREVIVNSPEELSGMLDKTFQDFETILTASQQNAAAAQTQAEPASGSYVKGTEDEEKFDKAEYFTLLEKDPVKANRYMNKHTYGTEDPGEVIKKLATELDEHKKVMSIYQFREGNPDYFGGPHNREVMEKLMERLGLEFNPEGLSAAWTFAKARGLAQVPQVDPRFTQQPPGNPQSNLQGPGPGYQNGQVGNGTYIPPNPYANIGRNNPTPYGQFQPTAPPPLGRGGFEPTPDIEAMVDRMTPDQLEEFIKRTEQSRR